MTKFFNKLRNVIGAMFLFIGFFCLTQDGIDGFFADVFTKFGRLR